MIADFDVLAESIGLPLKSIEALRALPESGETDAGIYFLWLGDAMQYIGKSRQIANRIAQHGQAALYGFAKPIDFDRHTCIAVFSERVVRDVPALNRALTKLERAYVNHYRPKYNMLYTGRKGMTACS